MKTPALVLLFFFILTACTTTISPALQTESERVCAAKKGLTTSDTLYKKCVRRVQLMTKEQCKKPSTTIEFCQKYGLKPHPDAPHAEDPSSVGMKTFQPVTVKVEKKIRVFCFDRIGRWEGHDFDECVIAYRRIYANQCHADATNAVCQSLRPQ